MATLLDKTLGNLSGALFVLTRSGWSDEQIHAEVQRVLDEEREKPEQDGRP